MRCRLWRRRWNGRTPDRIHSLGLVRFRLEMRKQDHVTNLLGSRQYHNEAVYTDPDPTGGRHPIFQRQQKILVGVLDLVARLVQEAMPLNRWIIQFRVARRDFLAVDN